MIKGKSVTSKRENVSDCRVPYRKIDALNVSSIKCYDRDPVIFYKEFILKHRRDEKKSVSTTIGDLVDFYLLECNKDEQEFLNRFDEKFALYQGVKGTGQVFLLADELFKVTQRSLNSRGEIVISFEDRFKEAYNYMITQGKYTGKTVDKVMEDFDKNGKDYFAALMDNSCKTVVEVSLVDKSRKVSDLLTNDPFTRDVFSGTKDIQYFPKFPIEWKYVTQGGKEILCKSEIDIMKIDDKNKIIYPIDLKTTYDNENFTYTYLKYRYDLQAAFYWLAIGQWAIDNGYGDYTVAPMEFVVGDTSANNRRPARFKTTNVDLDASLNGYKLRGSYYKGVHELIEEISWAEDNNMWNASKELCDNEGLMLLNLDYE
jgi:hypothetical protein